VIRAARVLGALLLLGGPAAAQTNSVTISPAGYVVVSPTQVTITIAWCGYPPPTQDDMDITTRLIRINGADSTSKFSMVADPAACGWEGPVADEVLYRSTGTITVTASTGPVTVYAEISNALNYSWSATETFNPPTLRRGVSVVPAHQFVTAEPSTGRSESFTMTNTGAATDSFTVSLPACAGKGMSTGCSLSTTGVTLASGASTNVTVSYTTSASAGTAGFMWFKATSTASAGAVDSTWLEMVVQGPMSTGVAIVGMAPGRGDLMPREACVAVALTEDAASECGDLRLAHALPPVRTMGTARAPTLLYNSQHARPKPIVLADVRLSPSVALPDSVIACIKVGGVSKGCERWAGSAWGAQGNTRRIAVRADDGLAAGEHSFTLEVTAKNGNQGPYTATERLFVVDRSASAFGAGWWLAGLEQLTVLSSTELLWVGGDGSVRRYVKDGSVYRAPKFSALDSIVVDGTDYVRRTAEHALVRFNSTGRHLKTTNSLGHETVFSYTGDRVSTIQVPTISGTVQYSFAYDGNNRLDSIAAPGGRGTKLFRTAARVDSIRDPDGTRVRFGSGAGSNQYVVTSRRDRKNNSTTFSYDAGNRISQAARPLSNTLILAVAETRGLTPLLPDSAYTAIDGPRSDVSDVVRLWLNGFGAPVRSRNPLGQETRIRYDATWPGLADSVLAPNRLGTRAFYQSARGLLDSVRVYQPLGVSGNALTSYTWHGSLNRITKVTLRTTSSTTLVDSLSYNGDGTLAWQQRGHSDKRIYYTYTAAKLPERLILPGNDTVTFTYNALGNLRKERSPSGFLSFYLNDTAGRDSLIVTPRGTGTEATDSAQVRATGVTQLILYDRMSRDTLLQVFGPAVRLPNNRLVPGDTIRTRTVFDDNGNRTSVVRRITSTLDSVGAGLNVMDPSEWQYDALNRVTQQRESGVPGWTVFTRDAAGNPTATATPRGFSITASYDALNRVTQRVVPQVTTGTSTCNYPVFGVGCQYSFPIIEGPTLCIAADTMRFQYDAAGNLTRADNNWARIRRAYAPNGLLTHDTLRVRTYETEAPNPCGGGDKRAAGEGPTSSDWSVHVYALGYEYDLAGRRTKLHHPNQLDPCSGRCAQSYGYHATFGTLDTLVHPSTSGGTLSSRFVYDHQLRLVTTHHPSTGTARSTTVTYDKDGRIVTRVGPATDDALTYDASGRIRSGTIQRPTGGWLTPALGYNGLGALQWADGATAGVTAEEFKTDALGNRLWVKDHQLLEGINRTRYHTIDGATGKLLGMALGTAACNPPGAGGASCHPTWYAYEFFQSHDNSGNVSATWGKDTQGQDPNEVVVPEESRSYYGADEKLVYYNRHLGWSTPGEGTGTFTEYRYDALGRRVSSRSRRPSTCSSPCEAYVQRWVWDGDQVLYEIRSSGKPGVSASIMNQEGGVASGDDFNLYGKIAYAHALGIDEPVGVLKHTNGTWYYLTPHANWRGEWSYGTLANGTICTTVATECPAWPGFQQSMDGWEKGSIPPAYTVWWGDLLRQGSDATRLQYRRNRYYDPQTGRFTQVDPIGLAGGLNLYGFAAGDPVNFTDPFGLSPCILAPQTCLAAVGGLVFGGVKLASNLFTGRPAFAGVGSQVAVGGAAGLSLGSSLLAGAFIRATASNGFSAAALASEVAAATGGSVSALAKSQGFKVTLTTGGRDVVARIKAGGDFRVSVEGLGSLTRSGTLSDNPASTHLKNATVDDVTTLLRKATELLQARRP
jgi:RHS repeat-associated protein